VFRTLDIPGAAGTLAYGVSGRLVVGYSLDGTGGQDGFIYDGSTYMMLDVPGSAATDLYGISGGSIVGTYIDRTTNLSHGFIYNGSAFMPLDAPGQPSTILTGISADTIRPRRQRSCVLPENWPAQRLRDQRTSTPGP